ncbi:MAG: hypothetical protein CBB68_03000 [Rhodospirillaceae bacterium TMED8]|nr:methyltransferase [Magnetovibrio sp.]OUT52335.1 MAG: hypothetical protein CBB68_03000 [Rhodospirillaceae bacterium TMED8]|tara:strand:- start:5756 stop:6523 length:768 start_codon:yes stop_codon:yes gene_type:complete
MNNKNATSDFDGQVTETWLLGGSVTCFQPTKGFRTAIDAVFMAAAVPAESGSSILDLGTGVGAAAFCLAVRNNSVFVTGLELQPAMAELAQRGVKANGLNHRVNILIGDLMEPPEYLKTRRFQHVMANPPYIPVDAGTRSPNPVKAIATMEGNAKLSDWVNFAVDRLEVGGTVTLVHRWDRMTEVQDQLTAAKCGAIKVLPLAPKLSGNPIRALIRGYKGRDSRTKIYPSLILHETGGSYTPAAERILRGGKHLF